VKIDSLTQQSAGDCGLSNFSFFCVLFDLEGTFAAKFDRQKSGRLQTHCTLLGHRRPAHITIATHFAVAENRVAEDWVFPFVSAVASSHGTWMATSKAVLHSLKEN
jgi:hypothetical protein